MSLPSPLVPASDPASYDTPSIRSPSEQITYMWWSTILWCGRLKVSARKRSANPMPTPFANPCPSGPVVTSMPSVWRNSGCPGVADCHWRKRFSSSSDRL